MAAEMADEMYFVCSVLIRENISLLVLREDKFFRPKSDINGNLMFVVWAEIIFCVLIGDISSIKSDVTPPILSIDIYYTVYSKVVKFGPSKRISRRIQKVQKV